MSSKATIAIVGQVRDVVVVGAGVVGSAIAYELSRRGADVLVVDYRGVGRGATQASAGMLAPYSEADRPGPLLTLGVRSLDLYDDFIDNVCADSGRAVAYARDGTLQVAVDEWEAERIERWAIELTASNVPCSFLDAAAARSAEPLLTPHARAAILIRAHGHVAARELALALVEAARARGATWHEPEPVRRVAALDRDMRVETSTSAIVARRVVLAAGSWSGSVAIEGLPPVPVRPVRGQLLQLAWSGEPLRRIVWGSGCYCVPMSDRSVLVGATVEDVGFDERATVDGVRGLLDAACALVPRAVEAGFLEARVGLRPGTPDALPVVGPAGGMPGLVYATGHYRNGVLLAPLTAAFVADLVIDGRRDPALDGLSPDRFSADPPGPLLDETHHAQPEV